MELCYLALHHLTQRLRFSEILFGTPAHFSEFIKFAKIKIYTLTIYTIPYMNCSAKRTSGIGHVCGHVIKFCQSQWLDPLAGKAN